jgi:hypothetical protein
MDTLNIVLALVNVGLLVAQLVVKKTKNTVDDKVLAAVEGVLPSLVEELLKKKQGAGK